MNSFEQVEKIKRDIMSYYLANVSLLTEIKNQRSKKHKKPMTKVWWHKEIKR